MDQFLLLLSIFLIILIGYFAGKKKLLPKEASSNFNMFIFYIAVPIAIISSFATTTKADLTEAKDFLLINLLIQIGVIVLLTIVLNFTKLRNSQKYQTLYSGLSGNIIYFAFPILLNIFGEKYYNLALLYVVVMITVPDLLNFLIIQFGNAKKDKNMLKNELFNFAKMPIVIATLIGVIIFILNLSLPQMILDSMNIVTKTITGLALISVGLNFAYNFKLDFSNINLNLVSAILKLFMLPGIVLYFTHYVFALSEISVITSVILASMPTSVFSIVVADMFDLDKKLASSNILMSSILFLVSSVFWMWALSQLSIIN